MTPEQLGAVMNLSARNGKRDPGPALRHGEPARPEWTNRRFPVSTFHVDLQIYTHTCPGNPEPHVVQTHRTVVHEIDGGPCRKPFGVDLACGRVLPPARQCRACRTHIIIRNTTTVDLGFQCPPRTPPPARQANAPQPGGRPVISSTLDITPQALITAWGAVSNAANPVAPSPTAAAAARPEPFVNALIARAGQPNYRQWLHHVQAAAACTRPVRLQGEIYDVRKTAGSATVFGIGSTATMPDEVIYKAAATAANPCAPPAPRPISATLTSSSAPD
jgi:hypothetical protein